MSVKDLKKNQKGVVKEIIGDNRLQRQRLFDLGFVPGQEVTCKQRVFGTYAIEVMGSKYGLRSEVVETIILK